VASTQVSLGTSYNGNIILRFITHRILGVDKLKVSLSGMIACLLLFCQMCTSFVQRKNFFFIFIVED